jgi:hypothetical protein
MKRLPYLLIGTLSLISSNALVAETARTRMYCLSIVVHLGHNYPYADTIALNYAARPDGPDELGVAWLGGLPGDLVLPYPGDYISNLAIYDASYHYTSYGTISLTAPTAADVNNNRFPDFFEVSLPTSGVPSYGSYSYFDPFLGSEYGSISATWTRSAGSKNGTCSMTFSDPYWGTFVSSYEILEYTGSLSYTPGSNTVTGSISLAQTGNPANTRQGSVQFAKSDTNRFDSLVIQPGIWNDASATLNYFTNHYFFRDEGFPTNYAGYVEFDDDGDAGTVYPFAVWVLSITDTNDVNHNGIPDFSDDPQAAAPPRRPQLSLASTQTNLLLTIRGDVGHVHSVQQVTALTSTNWQSVLSLTLTNDPVVVPLARPASPAFWRVLAQ